MKKLTITFIGILSYILVSGQTYSTVISDEDIYGFLNWMTKINVKEYYKEPEQKQIYYRISRWDTANFIPKEENSIEFIFNSCIIRFFT